MSAQVDSFLDLLILIEGVSAKKMFSGHGFYKNGLMFALANDGRLYLKTDEINLPFFELKGCEPFYARAKGGKRLKSSYYEPPESAFTNANQMKPWATQAVEASVRNATKAKKPRKEAAKSAAVKTPRRRVD